MLKTPFRQVLLVSVVSLLAILAPATANGAMTSNTTLGGAVAPAKPVISDVICSSGCLGLRHATIGGTLQISGRNLDMVTRVSFPGANGRILAAVSSASATVVTVQVPAGARSGRLRARDDYGSVSELSPAITFSASQVRLLSSSLRVLEAEIKPRRAYFFGARNPALSFVFSSPRPVNDLRVDVVEVSSGQIVRSFFRQGVPAGTGQQIRWNGRDNSGAPAPSGTYSFRIRTSDGGEATLSRRARRSAARKANPPAADDPLSFKMYSFIFPVQGRVMWGDGLGAGRGHQGQDLLTKCGKKVYAARGGTVIYKGNMSGAAGNYVVISGKASKLDFVYMHLLRPVRFKVGDTVRTGQVIGLVGATGRASACHLHFEVWGAPGWYKGGSPLSPTGMLRNWYRQ